MDSEAELPPRITYEEYLQRRKEGTIRAGVLPSVALGLIDYLPRRYQYAHAFWSWVWMLSIPAFVCLAIFWKWWAGLLLLVVVTPMISSATKRSCAEFVVEYAAENKEFFTKLVQENLLLFKEDNKK